MKAKLMPVHSSRDINEYIQSLLNSKRIGSQVVYHKILPASPPLWSDTAGGRNDPLNRLMKASGIQRLYSHQAQALDLIRSGRHVVTATPTASGKTLIYNLPVLERMMENPGVRALYMFPLKALAQDQL
ncbi:MAG: DEAD/DEAH box helicase, partial [Desulfobacterales bacterium]|nr:DEAD/DEAH box helicase [Desulfobacterales bacterium]